MNTPNRLRHLTLTLLLIGITAACSSANKRPQWLDNSAAVYPENRYLSATADARERETCSKRALANLARIFNVTVSDSSLDFAEARVQIEQDQTSISNSQQASRTVTTEVSQVLRGARLAEYWESPEGQIHCIAILDKAPAMQQFSQTVRQADQQTRDLVSYARGQAPNPVAALAALERARQLQQERDSVNSNLAVLRGRGLDSPHSTAEIERLIRDGLATLEIGADADTTELRNSLKAAIANLGIRYRADSPYVLRGQLTTAPVYEKQGWYWLRGSMQMQLLHNGDPIAGESWPIKVSATDRGVVDLRARDLLNAELDNYLYAMLTTGH